MIDFPQVHTVTRFIAREPDELDLEEADAVSVYQKSPDGQCSVLITPSTHTTIFTALLDFIRDYPGELAPER